MKIITKFGLLFYLVGLVSCQQGGRDEKRVLPKIPQEANYQRAEEFTWDSLSAKVYHLGVEPQWFADSSGFAYRAHTAAGEQYYKVLFSTQKRESAFDPKRLAQQLHIMTKDTVSGQKLPIGGLEWINPSVFTFFFQDQKYKVDLGDYTITELEKGAHKEISISPDGNRAVFIKDDDLYLRNLKSDESIALTQDGKASYIYGSAYGWGQTMKGENASPKPRLKVKWSPDSQKILTQITSTEGAEKMYLLDWSIDTLYRPQLLSYYRPSPGDTSFVKLIPVVFDLPSRKMTKIDLAPTPQVIDLGLNLKWTTDSQKLVGTYDRRGFQKKDIVEVNPETGRVRVLYTDKSSTNIDYHARFHFVGSENMAFFTSEKSGWKQIYKINWKTAGIKPVTQGRFVVKEIKAVDTTHQVLYFTAAGKEDGVNPYFNLFYKVNFDGSDLTLLTPEHENHRISVSPGEAYFVDNISSADRPTSAYMRRTKDGKKVVKVDSVDVRKLKDRGWEPPQIFNTKAHDGKTKLYGALWKPTDFDSEKSYPLVDFTYTGPHTNVFPNTFSKGVYGLYDSPQALAELGFVVMQVDGLGSNGRSKAFHDWSYKDLGNNLEDHTLAIRHLGQNYSWVDTTRVGIYGHSFGGYDAAHALLVFHDTYDVAIAESGDHDWRMEKAWYPELYAGWPVDSVYEKQSNITLAPQLKGKLLLIHGGIDENVNPSATFKLSEALIKADKYFDLLIIPSARHHFSEAYSHYVQKKRWHYFVDNLILYPPGKNQD